MDAMNYSIILQDKNKPGVPPVIQGVFTEQFDIKNPLPPMTGYSWTKPRDPDRIYPEVLWLVTKDKNYLFDYIAFWDGYIISSEFREILLNSAHPPYKEVRLNVINWKGTTVTEKQYFFIDISLKDRVDVINYKESVFELDEDMIKMRGQSLTDVKHNGPFFGNVKNYDSIVLDSGQNSYEIFRIKDTVIHDLVCSENFFNNAQKRIHTLLKIELFDMGKYKNRFR